MASLLYPNRINIAVKSNCCWGADPNQFIVNDASPSDFVPESCVPHKALFEEGSGGGGASENRLANFLRVVSVPGGDEGVATESIMESEDEGEGGGLW